VPQGFFEKIDLHRLLADLTLELDEPRVAHQLAAADTIPTRLPTWLLHERSSPSPRHGLPRPSSGNERVLAAVFVMIQPRVEQVSKSEFPGHRTNLLAGQDPTNRR